MQNRKRRAWLTPDSEEALAELLCRRFFVPDSPTFRESVSGALLELTHSWNWEQYGTMTPDETAAVMLDMYNRYALDNACSNDVPAPFWDDDDGGDADDSAPEDNQDWYGILFGEATWQEQIEDWFLAAFVAMTATPAAAIAFLTIAPKFRLAWKSADWGTIVKIFLDQTEIGTVDTYSASLGIVTFDVDVAAALGVPPEEVVYPVELWVEHTGTHNEAAVPDANGDFRMEVIRKRLAVEDVAVTTIFRQNPTDPCLLEQSIDDGANWTTAFDYGLCIPPSIAMILQLVGGQTQPVNPASPTQTWTSQDGDGDTEREARTQALCYAANAIVAQMADTALEIINGNLTVSTLSAIALGLAGTIAGLFVSAATGGVFLPLGLAIASAALAAASVINAAGAGVFEDTAVRDALACALLQNIMNKGVSLATFQTAFEGACFTGDTATVASVFTDMLGDPVNAQGIYDSFLNMLGNASGAALQGTLAASCVCDDTEWCQAWSFLDGVPDEWEVIEGTWSQGVGLTSNNEAGFTLKDCADADWVSHSVTIRLKAFLPAGVTIEDNSIVPTTALFITSTTTAGDSKVKTSDGCEIKSGSNIQAYNFTTPLEGYQEITVSMTNNSGGLNPMNMEGITLYGLGYNPFGACNC